MKRDYIEEAIVWCEIQRERWSSVPHQRYEPFTSGVISGYGWMKNHLEHIKKKGKKCRCPR